MTDLRLFRLTVGLALTACVAASSAATWRVEKDGSGDYVVIQDAVDAAAPGDTILVGPGRFETIRPIPWWEGYNATIAVDKGGLVVIGSGVSQTTIGAESTDWHYRAIATSNDPLAVHSFSISNIRISGGYSGLHYEGNGLLVNSCEFDSSEIGITFIASFHNNVYNSFFHDLYIGIGAYGSSLDITIAECQLERTNKAFSFQASSDCNLVDCYVRATVVSIQYDNANGVMSSCNIYGIDAEEYGSGTVLTGASTVNMTDCMIDMSSTNTDAALHVLDGSILTGTNNIVKGGGHTSMWISGTGNCDGFHGNEIYKADQYCLVAKYFNSDMSLPFVSCDMTDNYWGTDVSALIAIWIDDANDHPNDPNYWMDVDYQPFESDPVEVEVKTFSEVKDLFR